MKPKILVTGATGSTGSVAANLLLERSFSVRALVHRDDDRANALRAKGAEVVLGEFLDFRSMQRAFEDVQRAYFCYTSESAFSNAFKRITGQPPKAYRNATRAPTLPATEPKSGQAGLS